MRELKIGCGKPTGSKIGEPEKEEKPMEETAKKKEVTMATARIRTHYNGQFWSFGIAS